MPSRRTPLAGAPAMLTFLLMSKLSCYNGMDSCPGMYTNALDENVRGQSNIMDINSMPVYAWNTGDQADDYGRAYGVTPDNFSEYGYNSGMPAAFAPEYSN
ncbi:hypothetical protein T484DRAFT_1856740 [Baffinella frigidus]|nr:hypothetical protein T484DRAFT_1856740 [Cryptophyta sp. CCMP2293]